MTQINPPHDDPQQATASTSAAPPVPPPKPSYAAATSASTSPPKPPTATPLLDPVPSTSFFTQPPSQSHSQRPPPPPPPKKKPQTTYVDITDQDSKEDTKTSSVRAPIPAAKRGQNTSSFRPAGSSVPMKKSSSGGSKGWAAPPPPPTYRREAEERSPSRVGMGEGLQHQTSSTRSTFDTAKSQWSDEEINMDSPDEGPRGRQQMIEWTQPVAQNSGFSTIPALLVYQGEDGAIGGVWKEKVWDYEFELEGTKLKLGEFVSTKEERRRSKSGSAGEEDIQVDVQVDEREEEGPGYRVPTLDELNQIRPHPHAFFCPALFSWCIMTPDPSTHPSSTSPSLELFVEVPFQPGGGPSFVDIDLSPPLQPAKKATIFTNFENGSFPTIDWESEVGGGIDGLKKMKGTSGRIVLWSAENYFPTVLSNELVRLLIERVLIDPPAGDSRESALFATMSIVWRSLDNIFFGGQHRALPLEGKIIKKWWSRRDLVEDVFCRVLGFELVEVEQGDVLRPPWVDERAEEGRRNRRRLLRCWAEVGMWLAAFKAENPDFQTKYNFLPKLKLFPARKTIEEQVFQMPPFDMLDPSKLNSGWATAGPGTTKKDEFAMGALEYKNLGVVPAMLDADILKVYELQVADNPTRANFFFSALDTIAKIRGSEVLQYEVVKERSKGRISMDDARKAYDDLGVEFGTNEDAVGDAYSAKMEQATDPALKRKLREALQVVAKYSESSYLPVLIETAPDDVPKMTLEKALNVLALEKDYEPDMIPMIYQIRVGDEPSRLSIYQEAVTTIAEQTDNPTLKRFIKNWNADVAAWEAEPAPPSDRPIGLTNIANTCYLNSLLQYFFTIRELREAILQFSPPTGSIPRDAPLRRVGGREVSRKEVERSRRFVILLQGLFNQLIHSETSAVTPETELAYLALVPSKEEVDPKDSPEVIVEEPMEIVSTDVDIADGDESKSPSVLGKRGSEHLDSNVDSIDLEDMALDSQSSGRSPLSDRDVNRSEAMQRSRSKSSPAESEAMEGSRKRAGTITRSSENELVAKEAADGVVEIGEFGDVEMSAPASPPTPVAGPPPLPPRKPADTKKELERQVSSYMQFGRQNDVTECMDNVMFQVECALNPASDPASESAALSLLQSTFYGKMKQVLEIDDPMEKEPLRVKEEPFFSLLVDVAEEGRDVYDGLDTVFDDAIVEIEGKKARRTISLVDVPPILQIQLQRVQYDREAKKIFKSNAHMAFPNTISIDRYLEVDNSNSEAVARKMRTMECRQELEEARSRHKELTKAKHADVGAAMASTLNHLLDMPSLKDLMTDEMHAETQKEIEALQMEVQFLSNQIINLRSEVETLWASEEQAVFELVSVFIHRGTASSGHYFIYQRDSTNTQRWLKYNDSVVSEADPEQDIFRETTGDSNAYFLVYCRRDRLDAIDSMCRQLLT